MMSLTFGNNMPLSGYSPSQWCVHVTRLTQNRKTRRACLCWRGASVCSAELEVTPHTLFSPLDSQLNLVPKCWLPSLCGRVFHTHPNSAPTPAGRPAVNSPLTLWTQRWVTSHRSRVQSGKTAPPLPRRKISSLGCHLGFWPTLLV